MSEHLFANNDEREFRCQSIFSRIMMNGHRIVPPSLGIVRTYFYIHYSKIPGGFRVFLRDSALLAYRSILVRV